MKAYNDFSELVDAGIINEETAARIQSFYEKKVESEPNRLFLVFAILGALLVGLGIILIVAHNWDNMSRSVKTTFSFIPVIIGQVACGYALFKRMESPSWREGSAVFLFFAVGASISLISQIYNIEGNMAVFVVSWMVLCLPLVYLLRSSAVALLYLIGISYYAMALQPELLGHWSRRYYWILFLFVLPHYYYLYKNHPNGNSLRIFHLFIPLSFLITWPFILVPDEQFVLFILTGYMSLLGCIYLIGHSEFFRPQSSKINAYTAIASLGTVSLLLGCSYQEVWDFDDFRSGGLIEQMKSSVYLFALVFTLLGIYLFFRNLKGKKITAIKPVAWVFLIFFGLTHLNFVFDYNMIIINAMILLIGVLTIREGAIKNHLGILNYGLLILTILITIRFLDTDISFVWRGIIFLIIGSGFFLINNWMLKRRNANTTIAS